MLRVLLFSLAISSSASASSIEPPRAAAVHILSIELAAGGSGGAIRTRAERLSGRDVTYGFAEGPCKAHPLSDRVLTQLFDAMRAGARVEIEGVSQGEAQCVRRVRFLAP